MQTDSPSLEAVVNLAKRRGFFFPSAELYGGANGLYDLGPYGVAIASRIKELWWRRFVQWRSDVLGIDTAILTPAAVLEASGHTASFTDPLIECSECHIRLRSDHFLEEGEAEFLVRWSDEAIKQRKLGQERAQREAAEAWQELQTTHQLRCPNCSKQQFTAPRQFNMMFKTQLGAVEGEGTGAYLRPETAQGIFTNYKNILDAFHPKLPFGIAQIGKAFRNEITTGNSLFRVRELEQAEVEYFVKPGTDEAAFEMWLAEMRSFFVDDLGLTAEKIRTYEHAQEKLSHYSKRTVDYEYAFPFGWGEISGLANRTDFDLKQHQEHSKRDLTYFEESTRERFLPFAIEPSIGVGRSLLAVLLNSYREYPTGRTGDGTELEVVLHLPKQLAPIQVAVLPLMKKDGLAERAEEIYRALRVQTSATYDDSGAIGKRYRRHDEIGTPTCLTVDYQTLDDGTVTVRDRDTMEQSRVAVSELGTLF
jgi:glycyl-tRNA synthetase